jgi:hypothetical protein
MDAWGHQVVVVNQHEPVSGATATMASPHLGAAKEEFKTRYEQMKWMGGVRLFT